jgi:hypothetical protein
MLDRYNFARKESVKRLRPMLAGELRRQPYKRSAIGGCRLPVRDNFGLLFVRAPSQSSRNRRVRSTTFPSLARFLLSTSIELGAVARGRPVPPTIRRATGDTLPRDGGNRPVKRARAKTMSDILTGLALLSLVIVLGVLAAQVVQHFTQ